MQNMKCPLPSAVLLLFLSLAGCDGVKELGPADPSSTPKLDTPEAQEAMQRSIDAAPEEQRKKYGM